MSKTKHTPGAIRAAEIIASDFYDEYHRTGCIGRKTTEGIASIAELIDSETAGPDLLQALLDLRNTYDAETSTVSRNMMTHALSAIRKAKRA